MHSTIGHYSPMFLGAFVLICAFAHVMSIPIAPVVIIVLVGEILIVFQMDHHRIPRLLRALLRAVRTDHTARLRQIH